MPRFTPLHLEARTAVIARRSCIVRLYFAEMDGLKPGQRVFDVSLQGQLALTKLDVVAEAGGPKREVVKEVRNVNIADLLTIGFTRQAGEPILSGVEVIASE